MTTTRSAISETTPEIVRDQENGHVGILAKAAKQVEDLRLDRHVERRCGLVGNEKLGIAGERHGNHDALAHTARHLMRIIAHTRLRAGDADLAEKVDSARERFFLAKPSRGCG